MRAAALLGLALGLLAGVGSVPASADTAGAPATAATSALPPLQPVTWNFTQAHVTGGQGAGRYGSGVTVAVIDTWVDASHPDFGGRVVQGADCRSGTCVPGSAPIDSCGHGTHVAGTIASETYGVAPLARILPVTVLGADATGACSGSTAAVAAGIAWATTHGAQVENLSIGEDSPALLQDAAVTAAISSAAAAGVVVTVAAGNANRPGQNADMYVPSYGDKALVVAATGPGGLPPTPTSHRPRWPWPHQAATPELPHAPRPPAWPLPGPGASTPCYPAHRWPPRTFRGPPRCCSQLTRRCTALVW